MQRCLCKYLLPTSVPALFVRAADGLLVGERDVGAAVLAEERPVHVLEHELLTRHRRRDRLPLRPPTSALETVAGAAVARLALRAPWS